MVAREGNHISLVLEASENSSEEELLSSETQGPRWGIARPVLIAIVLFALVATVVVASYPKKVPTTQYFPSLRRSNPSAITMLQATPTDPCRDFPFLDMQTVLRSNLGLKGPDFEKGEGLVFEGFDREPGQSPKPVELHVNVVSDFNDFHPANTKKLGFFNGPGSKFMGINLREGTEVTLKFTVTERGSTAPIRLNKMDLTFFDLDTHRSGKEVEFVKMSGFKSQMLYEGTQLRITGDPSGVVTYTATQPGNASDNPTDPTNLTELQLQKAVSVEFEPFTEATVTLGSTQAHFVAGGRLFAFMGRPSVKCATGVDPDKVIETTPTCCVIKIGPVQLICTSAATKQWYHFMC